MESNIEERGSHVCTLSTLVHVHVQHIIDLYTITGTHVYIRDIGLVLVGVLYNPHQCLCI